VDDEPTPGAAGEPADDDDPFAHLTLDEQFVQAATITEPAATERAGAAARVQRQEQLRRMLDQERPGGTAPTEGWQRLAGDGWDDDTHDRPPRRRHSLTLRVVALVLLLTLVAVYVMSHLFTLWATRSSATVADAPSAASTIAGPSSPSDPSVQLLDPDQSPPPPEQVSDRPLGTPAAVPAGGGPHAFLTVQPDGRTPVAYDPCRPIHYVTRAGGPDGGDQWIRQALATASTATGLQFVDDGATDEAPSDDRPAYQPARYGDRWAPVLFAWSDPVESPRLGQIDPAAPGADPTGFAGSSALGLEGRPDDAQMVYVTGGVTLDADDLARLADEPDGVAQVTAVIAHEVGHLLGLAHVEASDQLMFPVMRQSVTGYAAGDLEGLAALGRGACFPDV
jgi:hypothetical protein